MQECDARLVERAREGDTTAFGALIERYRTTVYGLACAQLGNRDEALDAAQEAFIEAFVGLHSLRDATRFRPWLLTILSRRCSAILRRHSRETGLVAQVGAIAGHRRPEPDTLRLVLEEALASLPVADQQVFRLGAIDGLTYREIASCTRMSVAAVRSRMYRARARLAKELTTMSDTATTLLTRDVMRRLLTRVGETSSPLNAPTLASLVSDAEDAEVAEVARGLASIMEKDEPLERALMLASALPPGLTGLVGFGNREGRGATAVRAAARALEEGLLQPAAPVETTAVAAYCACVGSLLQAGVPFLQALEFGGTVAPAMATVANHAVEELNAGRHLSAVLGDFPDIFTPTFCMIVRLGEETAWLDMALTLMAGMLWAPETLDTAAIGGPWHEHMDQARRRMEAQAAWRARHPG